MSAVAVRAQHTGANYSRNRLPINAALRYNHTTNGGTRTNRTQHWHTNTPS